MTSKGQVTIPLAVRQLLGMRGRRRTTTSTDEIRALTRGEA